MKKGILWSLFIMVVALLPLCIQERVFACETGTFSPLEQSGFFYTFVPDVYADPLELAKRIEDLEYAITSLELNPQACIDTDFNVTGCQDFPPYCIDFDFNQAGCQPSPGGPQGFDNRYYELLLRRKQLKTTACSINSRLLNLSQSRLNEVSTKLTSANLRVRSLKTLYSNLVSKDIYTAPDVCPKEAGNQSLPEVDNYSPYDILTQYGIGGYFTGDLTNTKTFWSEIVFCTK